MYGGKKKKKRKRKKRKKAYSEVALAVRNDVNLEVVLKSNN